MAATPMEDYALIGDMHTAALVSRDGAIDWLCLPRFDDAACFAALLHDRSAGHWTIAPAADDRMVSRHYEEDTLVLRTRWQTAGGVAEVVDFMPPRGTAADVVRIVEGISGRVDMTTVLCLRFDYGRVRPWIRPGDECGTGEADDADDGNSTRHARSQHPRPPTSAIAGPDAVWIHADAPLREVGDELCAAFTVAAGDTVGFVLTHRRSHLPRPDTVVPVHALERTRALWRTWIGRCRYTGRWQAEVRRALILLKALTFTPTGGMVAAVTTSLPECLGGERNWDYRYCWLRDATFTLQAFLGTGYVAEARAWREWLVRAVAGDPAELQIMYGLDGTRRLPETTLPWLAGYAGSGPVRTGNAATGQLQLDVWGEALDGLHLAREAGLHASDSEWMLQCALADWIVAHWHAPDNGLWEMRGPRRHFVHSKVMAWAGLDRVIRSAEKYGLSGDLDAWRTAAAQIHAEVCARGFDRSRGTFTQYYGSQGLDASLLLLPRVGFLPWDDPRIVGTVTAVSRALDRGGFLLRYDTRADGGPDGLPGAEGVFLACSFWLVDALHGIGENARADALFERLLDLRSDVGMLSEEYDPDARRHLGNTPQAFSLVGLVNSARHLSDLPPSSSSDTCS